MIGLPLSKFPISAGLPCELEKCEEKEIIDFIVEVSRKTRMFFNINVGIFIPKPHTPYQWAAQIEPEQAAAKLDFIRKQLKPLGHKVSVSDPLISTIEGFVSRGDERAGLLIEEAYRKGSRLDAWTEYRKSEVWQEIVNANKALIAGFLDAKNPNAVLPWQDIHSGVSHAYLLKEFKKSQGGELSPPCKENCVEPCGICGAQGAVTRNIPPGEIIPAERQIQQTGPDPSVWRIVFSFSKQGSAVFQSHLGLLEIFSMALTRSCLPAMYTQGFNPLVKLEIASPLALGISAGAEIAALDFKEELDTNDFISRLNRNLPDGLRVCQAENYFIPSGKKKHSLASLLWGFCYAGKTGDTYIEASLDKSFRSSNEGTAFGLHRKSVLAKNAAAENSGGHEEWASYFDVFRQLYLVTG
jgi:radical SAM-linked protein